MTIRSCAVVFFSIAISVNIHGMSHDNIFEALLIDSAQLALSVSGDSRKVEELGSINESSIKKVSKYIGTNAEIYSTTLADGSWLVADYFHAGSMAGQISCSRYIRDTHGMSIDVPVSSHYFHLLKRIAEQEQKIESCL